MVNTVSGPLEIVNVYIRPNEVFVKDTLADMFVVIVFHSLWSWFIL